MKIKIEIHNTTGNENIVTLNEMLSCLFVRSYDHQTALRL